MIDVKILEGDELRAAHTLFRAAMHNPPADDARWQQVRSSFLPGRTFGAYDGGALVGTTMSLALPMTVPGGAVLPSAAVTRVGVRADRTRRGVLNALMREQLMAAAAAGEPLASLRASEYPIYGRYGYGVATRGRNLLVDRKRAAFHSGVPTSGEVRLVDHADLTTVLPRVYERVGTGRPGFLRRDESKWTLALNMPPEGTEHVVGAVHTGPEGDDGLVVYRTERTPTPDDPWALTLMVEDLHAAGVEAAAGLWRFVLGVDLISAVKGWLRPLDEPLPLLLADPRAARTDNIHDEAWVRLVDVPAALSARSWAGSEAVVLAVHDAVLPANSGSYRITPDGVTRVDERPQLECDIAVLGRLYLADVSPSTLAATGWLTVHDPAVLPAADALFATGIVPWSGTFF